jgi:peroxiredoxin Q/BCP
MSNDLQVGDDAPLFTTTAVGGRFGEGQRVTLGDFRGHPVVLYFYPKDDTPGCTTQACSLRDSWPLIPGPVEIFGISPDPVKSHQKFINKYQLPFPLLVDEGAAIAKTYGVWVEKTVLPGSPCEKREDLRAEGGASFFCESPIMTAVRVSQKEDAVAGRWVAW